MARTSPPDREEAGPAPTQRREWRLQYHVGDLVHYTEWSPEFAAVENLYEQYRREDCIQDVVIERRTEVRA